MNNKEIAKLFSELADLMELQNENPFKIKSYRNAHVSLRKIDTPLNTLSQTEMEVLPGVGKAIAEKITQIVSTGKMPTLEKYRAIVPEGVREMLKVHGLGPKKIDVIWRKLGIESPGELLYACDENRLVELPGFGTKTQEDVKSKLAFYFNASGKYLYPKVSETLQTILDELN
ncbi:MAG TPA: helix-hairpin-helix domain-containing protein, partial [Saprospiraceae bacterium]|nr:helix-hairpin-helix domain-containing protein [Saprospiraceae bacterium]